MYVFGSYVLLLVTLIYLLTVICL